MKMRMRMEREMIEIDLKSGVSVVARQDQGSSEALKYITTPRVYVQVQSTVAVAPPPTKATFLQAHADLELNDNHTLKICPLKRLIPNTLSSAISTYSRTDTAIQRHR